MPQFTISPALPSLVEGIAMEGHLGAVSHFKLGYSALFFEDIHPFADGNGRTGRALALWELYRRGFDSHHLFSVDEYYWEDRPAYYAALEQVRLAGEDLSRWLEYAAVGLKQTLERVWRRVQQLQSASPAKLTLTAKQEHLLGLLRDRGSLLPRRKSGGS